MKIPSWAVPLLMAVLSGLIAYYAAQVTLEHRLTALEDGQKNIWWAINYNHAQTTGGKQ